MLNKNASNQSGGSIDRKASNQTLGWLKNASNQSQGSW